MSKRAEFIISICAIIIAVLSLFVATFENYQQRRYQRLSIRPALRIIYSTENDWEGFKLINSGLGPARINWIKVFVNSKRVYNWKDVMTKLNLLMPDHYSINAIYPNDVYQPNEVLNLFYVNNQEIGDSLRKYNKRIRINICYCSYYDECWLASNDIDLNNSAGCFKTLQQIEHPFIEL